MFSVDIKLVGGQWKVLHELPDEADAISSAKDLLTQSPGDGAKVEVWDTERDVCIYEKVR